MTDLGNTAADAAVAARDFPVDSQGRRVFLIPEARIAAFLEHMASYTKRARRLGLGTAAVEIGAIPCLIEQKFKDWDGETRKIDVPYLPVRVAGGEPIKAAGWEFIARLERVGAEHLVHVRPGIEAPAIAERYHSAGNACEHCNTVRDRKDTYICRHEDGRQMQIGSTCLKDFLGCDSPAGLAARFQLFTEATDACNAFDGEYLPPTATVESTLAIAATLVRTKGFASRAMVQRMHEENWPPHRIPSTTSGLVSLVLFAPAGSKEAAAIRKLVRENATDADREQAKAVIAYWSAIVAPGSEYERNLSILLRQPDMIERHMGLVVSALPAWARAAGLQLGPVRVKRESNHVGTVGERLRGLIATVENKRTVSSSYGDMTLVKLIDDDGNRFAWFASSSRDFKMGARVRFDATVKAHREHEGRKETQITRCTFKGDAPAVTDDPDADASAPAVATDAAAAAAAPTAPQDPAPAATDAPAPADDAAARRRAAAQKAWVTIRAKRAAAAEAQAA